MSNIIVFLVTLFSMSFLGCQVTPTKVSETRVRPAFELVNSKAEAPIVINEQTIILDTRSSFEYGLNHVLNSQHFPWVKLAEKESTGEVLKDTHKAILQLSLMGVTPSTPVVVIGKGLQGRGEAGRLAWNLLYLGVTDVQVADVEMFRTQLTQHASPPPKNATIWSANIQDKLQINKSAFLLLSKNPKLRLSKRIHIVDVRSPREYIKSRHSDLGAVNIEWTQFYSKQGRPNFSFLKKLAEMDILPADRMVVLSDHGVRSASVCYALLAMGFSQVENFTGGINAL